MARYGHQQLWPEGVIDAPWAQVLEVHDAVCALVEMESKKD